MKSLLVHILICTAAPSFATATEIDIPRQVLGASLQDLARQSGTQIVFLSKLVEGRAAPPVRGDVSVDTALAVLLEGSALTYRRLDSRTIQIEAGPDQMSVPPAVMWETRLDEFEVNAQDGAPGALRRKLLEIESRFAREYNKRNTDHQFDLACSTQIGTGTLIGHRMCQAVFVQRAYEMQFSCLTESTAGVTERYPDGSTGTPYTNVTSCAGQALDPAVVIMQKLPAYQENMIELVRRNPELRDLLFERTRLARKLEAAGRKRT